MPAIPPVLLGLGAVVSWVSAIGLVIAARSATPPIGALTERATIAVLISAFLTVYSVVALNADGGFIAFDFVTTQFILRCGALLLAVVAPVWLYLYFTGRLGEGGRG